MRSLRCVQPSVSILGTFLLLSVTAIGTISAEAPSRRVPASVPASRPATQPSASPQPAGFTPLGDARTGEWVLYRAMGETFLRYEVKAVRAATVDLQVQVFQRGYPLGLPAVYELLRAHDPIRDLQPPVSAKRHVRTERIQHAGRSWTTRRWEERWQDEGVSYRRVTWVSDKAPVLGVVRMTLHGDNVLEA